jgi:hypothetical protein
LTSHELKRAELLMLEKPVAFYDFYLQCLKQQEASKEESKSEAPKTVPRKVVDLDDLSLFIVLFGEKKFSCSVYAKEKASAVESSNQVDWSTEKVLMELQTGSITQLAALKYIILSKDLPRNDNFIKMYT